MGNMGTTIHPMPVSITKLLMSTIVESDNMDSIMTGEQAYKMDLYIWCGGG